MPTDVTTYFMLGSLEILSNGCHVRLPAAKHRALLAPLLLEPNRFVSIERLTYVVWGDRPPARAVDTIRNYVLRVRRALTAPHKAGQLIETGSGGYRITVDPGRIDVMNFCELIASARLLTRVGDHAGAAAHLRDALRLWRGTPFADVPSEFLRQTEATRLIEARAEAFELLAESELAMGHGREIVSELVAETRVHPGRESLWRLLLLALYQAGRKSDALSGYQTVARYVRLEYGVDPGPQLRELYVQILRDDARLR